MFIGYYSVFGAMWMVNLGSLDEMDCLELFINTGEKLPQLAFVHTIFEPWPVFDEHIRNSFTIPLSQLTSRIDINERNIDVTSSRLDHAVDRLDRFLTEVTVISGVYGYRNLLTHTR